MSGILIFVGTPATKISAAPPRLWLRRYFEARPPLVTGSVIGTNREEELVAAASLTARAAVSSRGMKISGSAGEAASLSDRG